MHAGIYSYFPAKIIFKLLLLATLGSIVSKKLSETLQMQQQNRNLADFQAILEVSLHNQP